MVSRLQGVRMRIMPRLFAGLVVSLALAVPAFSLETFPDEAKAQQHSPLNVVVWLAKSATN